MLEASIEGLNQRGFIEINGIAERKEAEALMASLPEVRPFNGHLWFELTPKRREDASRGSFSAQHGFGTFPLHTDTAFWNKPARYAAFLSEVASSASTLVLPACHTKRLLDEHKPNNPIFTRESISGVSYATPWFGPDSQFIRFDPRYMKPANSAAEDFITAVEREFDEVIRIEWMLPKLLILDNWRVLHGRESVEDSSRKLTRQYRG